MTLNIYLLFFTLFFSVIIYAYVLFLNEEEYKLVAEGQIIIEEMILGNSNSVKTQDIFIGKQKQQDILTEPNNKIELTLKLKKYNQQLNRSLNTLAYISGMEADSLMNQDQLKDLLNLKVSVQYEVVRITKKISYCKSRIEESVLA